MEILNSERLNSRIQAEFSKETKRKAMLRQVDLLLEKYDTSHLFSSLAVKINAYLMGKINQELAAEFHKQELRSYSLFTYEQENIVIFRFSTLNDAALPLFNVCLNTKKFKIFGVENDIKVIRVIRYPDIMINELKETPVPKVFRLLFASPATYKQGKEYCHIFALPQLLYSVADKLRANEFIDIPNQTIDTCDEILHIDAYSFASEKYAVKKGNRIPGFVGEAEFHLTGTEQQNASIMLLLRYACYSGLGAKTALGMGGMLIGHAN